MNKIKAAFELEVFDLLLHFILSGSPHYVYQLREVIGKPNHFSEKQKKAIHSFLNTSLSVATVSPLNLVAYGLEFKKLQYRNQGRSSLKFRIAYYLMAGPFYGFAIHLAQGKGRSLPKSVKSLIRYSVWGIVLGSMEIDAKYGKYVTLDAVSRFTMKRVGLKNFLKLRRSMPEYSDVLRADYLLRVAEIHLGLDHRKAAQRRLENARCSIESSAHFEKTFKILLFKYSWLNFKLNPPASPEEGIFRAGEAIKLTGGLFVSRECLGSMFYLLTARSQFYSVKGRHLDAIADFNRIIELQDQFSDLFSYKKDGWSRSLIHYALSDKYTAIGRYTEALGHINQAIQLLEKTGGFEELKSFHFMNFKHTFETRKWLLTGNSGEAVRVIDEHMEFLEGAKDYQGLKANVSQLQGKWKNSGSFAKLVQNKNETIRRFVADVFILTDNNMDEESIAIQLAYLKLYKQIIPNADFLESNSDGSEVGDGISRLFANIDNDRPARILTRMLVAGASVIEESGHRFEEAEWQGFFLKIQSIPKMGDAEKSLLISIINIRRAIGLKPSGGDSEGLFHEALAGLDNLIQVEDVHIEVEAFDLLELSVIYLNQGETVLKTKALDCMRLLESILWKMEAIRLVYLVKEDRVTIDARLKRIYRGIASAYSKFLSSAEACEGSLGDFLSRLTSLYVDRAESRFFSSFARKASPRDYPGSRVVPEETIKDYEVVRSDLDVARAGLRVEAVEEQEITRESYQTRSIQRLADPTAELDEEHDAPGMDAAIQELHAKYEKAVEAVRCHLPDFNPGVFTNISVGLDESVPTGQNRLRLHLFSLQGKIHLVLYSGSTCTSLILGEKESERVSEELGRKLNHAATFPGSRETGGQGPVSGAGELIDDFISRHANFLNKLTLEVCISPDFGFFPLHSLRCGPSQLLGQKYHLFYNSSIGIGWQAGRRQRASGNALIVCPMGNSSDLPFALAEAAIAWSGLGGPKRLLSEDATFRNIRDYAGSASIFHFSGHMMKENSDALLNGFPLADGTRVTVETCLSEPFAAEGSLVVLNGCSSGKLKAGTDSSDPGMDKIRISELPRFERFLAGDALGLASALLLTGSRCVIATLWDVDDLSSALFMWKLSHFPQEEGRNLAHAVAECSGWLRDGIQSGVMLRDEIFPLFLADMRKSGLVDDSVVEACLRQIDIIAVECPERPPFEDIHYWGAYVLTGSPIW